VGGEKNHKLPIPLKKERKTYNNNIKTAKQPRGIPEKYKGIK
jgi:hypothetical protein